MLTRSPKGKELVKTAVLFSMGSDSPVKAASSTKKSWASNKRTSAGKISPLFKSNTSPGTKLSAATFFRWP